MATSLDPDPVAPALAMVEAHLDLPAPDVQRQLIEAGGLSQQAVADVCGVSRSYVAHWLRGASRPRGEVALTYMNLLKGIEAMLQERAMNN